MSPVALERTYSRIAELPLHIEEYELSGLELWVSDHFTRLSTVVHLYGAGHEGQGEDTTYAPPDQTSFRADARRLPLAGDWTLDAFGRQLGTLDLFPRGASHADFRRFRRWAFESAALDLALRQAGLSLAVALGRVPRPVSYVVSPGPETSAASVAALHERYPEMRLKLMAAPAWDAETMLGLAATGVIDVVDLKGQYDEDVPVALRADAALYERVLRAFPDAWVEDPGVTPETEPVLRPHWPRVTWDAPIRSVGDIARCAVRPRMLNIKPSRFGSLPAVLDAYDLCAEVGIGTYGGGQFELGPGRGQIQLLASLFHPDAPNDVAPTGFNESPMPAGLRASPLPVSTDEPGFRAP